MNSLRRRRRRRQVSKVVDGIAYVPDYEETEVTTKGTKWFEKGESFLFRMICSCFLFFCRKFGLERSQEAGPASRSRVNTPSLIRCRGRRKQPPTGISEFLAPFTKKTVQLT